MNIAWGDLGQVLAIGLLAGAGVVALFAFGVTSLAGTDDGAGQRGIPAAARATAVLCFALCATAVGYGIYTLIPSLH